MRNITVKRKLIGVSANRGKCCHYNLPTCKSHNILYNQYRLRELLKQDNINVNLKSNYIKTPLMRAIEDKYDDIAYELLAKEGIDVNIRDNYGQTALIMAVKRNRKQLVQRMINLPDINLNKRDNNGRTALVHAYNKGYMEIVEHLMLHESVRNKLHLTYVDG